MNFIRKFSTLFALAAFSLWIPAFSQVATNTVASLKLLSVSGLSTGYQASVAGYYSAGDGGGGLFLYDSLATFTDNGGTIIAPTVGSGRWIRSYSGRVNALWFGAYNNNSNTSATTIALNKAHALGEPVYYPSGIYSFSTLSCNSGGIIGDGSGRTILVSADTSGADLFTFTGTGGSSQVPLFRDFLIEAANTKPAGAGIRFLPGSGEMTYALIDNVTVYNVPIGINFSAASHWNLTNSRLLNYATCGVLVANSNNNDSGDSVVSGCTFNTAIVSGLGYGILQQNSGGLKVIGNKILGGNSGYVLQYNGNVIDGDLLINGNSIEQTQNYAIYLGRASGTHSFGAIVITGNQIAISANGIATDSSGALSQLVIASNNIALSSGSGVGIYLNNVAGYNIASNNIIGGGGSPTGINLASNCSSGSIGNDNTFVGLTVPVINQVAPNTIVSAATISLSANDALIAITGTATISNIAGGYTNRSVFFTIPNGVSFAAGGNIATSITKPANSVAIAVFNGTSWYIQ